MTPNLDFTEKGMTGKDLLDLTAAKTTGAPISLLTIHDTMRDRGMTERDFEEELQAMIDEFDRDQDGEISNDEFLYIMKQSTMY